MIRVGKLLWDEENFVDENGNDKFTYEEALAIAEKYGKRLPTRCEVESLFHLFAYDFTGMGIKFPSYGLTFRFEKSNPLWISKLEYSENYTYLFMDKDIISIILTTEKHRKYSVRFIKDIYECGEFVSWGKMRCEIASRAMQSLIISNKDESISSIAEDSIYYADKLIELLRGDKAHGI